MRINLPNNRFKIEGIRANRLGQILEMTPPRYEYTISDGANGTENITFSDEQDFQDFRQTLKFYLYHEK
ncbi:MAG: hypothetical protein A2W85_06335 [Bacteroidetes bacterium GWF2_41_31]|nr:MAG: hypothetical protein A2W85_06335 [Bacteroidetes bacterium GWF2_41_31]